MRLADLELELRPRHAWEAVDLGQAMFRRWWWPLQSAWLITFVPLAIGLGILFADRPYIALAILWWLLPLVERAPLFVLGRRVFGSAPTLVDLMGELPRLWSRRALWRLTVARLSPWRGFAAPVAILEQSGGAKARRRASTLMGGGGEGSVALAVSCVCWLFVIALAFAQFSALGMLLPSDVSERLEAVVADWFLGESARWPGLLLYAMGCAAFSVVGPLFVATNFALYLNRRIFLEGWDIEVAFRALADRLARAGRRGAAFVVCATLALVATAPTARAALAQEERDPGAVIERVLAHEDFDTTETVSIPMPKSGSSSGSLGLGPIVAQIFAVLLVAGVVVLLLYLVHLAAKHAQRRGRGGSDPARSPAPVVVAGLDVRPESLPDDPASTALVLWRRGEAREALGLLYRASIARIAQRHDVAIADGDTEGLCLERVRAARITQLDVFTDLTRAWQQCAYGDRVPSDGRFEQLVGAWRGAFPRVAEDAA